MEADKPKSSFCRFYLRGLCMLEMQECAYAHGIRDLQYKPYQEGEVIQYDYLAKEDINQRVVLKGPRVYKNLFEFQLTLPEKAVRYTLEQLNQEKTLRSQLRTKMHHLLFQQFMELLEKNCSKEEMTEEFLIREYTRAGFNKLMTRIKYSHLTEHLCETPNSKYYKNTVGQKTFITRKAQQPQIDAFYKHSYEAALLLGLKEESQLKKHFSLLPRPQGVPHLYIILKEKRMSWNQYLGSLLGEKFVELTVNDIAKEAATFLKMQIQEQKKCPQWSSVFQHLSKHFKCNNANILIQVKPLLVLKGYVFHYFPMLQFITHANAYVPRQTNVCNCPYQEPYDLSDLLQMCDLFEQQKGRKDLEAYEQIDIVDMQSLLFCMKYLLSSKVIGVDLEGRLRKNGYVELIQIHNGRNTFIIDIYQMDLRGDVQTFSSLTRVLRNIMVDEGIEKIFHDCRHDSLALHEFIRTCVKNVFDTSAVETYLGQIELYQQKINSYVQNIKQEDQKSNSNAQKRIKIAKDTLAMANNIKTPGLNEILKKYEAPHGINESKEKFHKMWTTGQTSFFDERPLHPEYREYCVKDVLDLLHVSNRMKQKIKFIDMAKWISAHYVNHGYSLLEEESKQKLFSVTLEPQGTLRSFT